MGNEAITDHLITQTYSLDPSVLTATQRGWYKTRTASRRRGIRAIVRTFNYPRQFTVLKSMTDVQQKFKKVVDLLPVAKLLNSSSVDFPMPRVERGEIRLNDFRRAQSSCVPVILYRPALLRTGDMGWGHEVDVIRVRLGVWRSDWAGTYLHWFSI